MMQMATVYVFLAGFLFIGTQGLSYLDAHNKYRKMEGVPSMKYDKAIEQNAAKHASKCLWKHSSQTERQQTPGYSYLGENLFLQWGSGSVASADYVVGQWYDEKKDYDRASLSCTPGKVCGHYTQVVWAKSTAVGCAVQTCATMVVNGRQYSNAIFVVCQYGPGGNIRGQSPFQQRSLNERSSTMTLLREIAEKLRRETAVGHEMIGPEDNIHTSETEDIEESSVETVDGPPSYRREKQALTSTMVM
ncbi:uncharacterized protein LOC132544223 [Ylistrum balloti]|uniref:uncharacterized protein LOC132544223 n=1 Tax=Ylistrum balloti TaxID=509963 RepID=UPI002905C89C|nr:uncharacterized protein LOC132544223 [Ylistrum balloti]